MSVLKCILNMRQFFLWSWNGTSVNWMMTVLLLRGYLSRCAAVSHSFAFIHTELRIVCVLPSKLV